VRRIYVRTYTARNFVRGVLFSSCIQEVNSSYRDSDTSFCNRGTYWPQGNSRMVPVIRVVLLPAGPKRPRLILLDFPSKRFWALFSLILLSFPVFHDQGHIMLRALLFNIYVSPWKLTIESCVALRRGYILRWFVRRFRRCANVIDCSYTNLDSIAYYIPSLHDTTFAPSLQTCTSYYFTEYCRQL